MRYLLTTSVTIFLPTPSSVQATAYVYAANKICPAAQYSSSHSLKPIMHAVFNGRRALAAVARHMPVMRD